MTNTSQELKHLLDTLQSLEKRIGELGDNIERDLLKRTVSQLKRTIVFYSLTYHSQNTTDVDLSSIPIPRRYSDYSCLDFSCPSED